jgi:hypothetical protein
MNTAPTGVLGKAPCAKSSFRRSCKVSIGWQPAASVVALMIAANA